jgi:HD-GYP domain-containing protein (c-di-GMP phosphodiesterase class II)
MTLDSIDQHGRRSAWLTIRLCERLDLPRRQVRDFALAALTHDIGKHALPEALLNKPAMLSAGERRSIEQHCEIGASMLLLHPDDTNNDASSAAVAVALSHHEWWNGAGYPFGLSGQAIPRCARIVAVADVFDALMSLRPYKSAWSMSDSIGYIAAHAGTQFDPECVDAMVSIARDLPLKWEMMAQTWPTDPITIDH